MIHFKGVRALSPFKKTSLLHQIQAIEPKIKDIDAEYIHIVSAPASLPNNYLQILEQLLTYDEPFTGKQKGRKIIVGPRQGTISSWSSKATDIAQNSGLTTVNRIERATIYYIDAPASVDSSKLLPILHDRMTESIFEKISQLESLFVRDKPKPFTSIELLKGGRKVLENANTSMGLALSTDEIDYLTREYTTLGRNPSDAELMMFSVVNSEHCRHKIFNAQWQIDGKRQQKSLFKKIKNTYENYPTDILSAYSDNAAVLRGATVDRFYPDPQTGVYKYTSEPAHIVTKVETHNHPTAVAPIPGAATGAGGEIRDEGATGRGAKPKMGLAGYTVSNLNLPNSIQPWEKPYGKPDRIVSALDIMIDAPIGAAAYNNEFGRPNLAGYFRTYEQAGESTVWGYHKPIMIAGGVGNIKDEHVEKGTLPVGAALIVLGGPSMLIGLGGGTASSMQTGASSEDLDFASVQRANAEIERRVQEVINTCWALGKNNPIITIHDVGAGGLSNALPELVHDSGRGAHFELRSVPSAEPGMTPMEIWCNEAQERYVLGINDVDIERFTAICERERCPFAIVGTATQKEQLVVHDELFKNNPVDIPMSLLFGNAPRMIRSFDRVDQITTEPDFSSVTINDAIKRVLHVPAVGSKKFLITIGDRSVGGLTVRDQMVGPWQVPVSDVAVTASTFGSKYGEAMAMGERTPLALIDSAASARMAVSETITNIAGAPIEKLSDIKLSANWMAAAGYGNEDQHLFDAVTALGENFCAKLDLTIPVGKDSLSMRTAWNNKSVTSPLSLIISGFALVIDTRKVLTPQLDTRLNTQLILIDLGKGKNRIGGSVLTQVYNQIAGKAPDIDPKDLKTFFNFIQEYNRKDIILAYHDRSDGGLLATAAEMAFASRCGLKLILPDDSLEFLLNEELGAIIQVRSSDTAEVVKEISTRFGSDAVHVIGTPTTSQTISIHYNDQVIYKNTRATLEKWWSSTSYEIQKIRDNVNTAEQEYNTILEDTDPGLQSVITYLINETNYSTRPRVAIMREQGVNGQVEMAAAFDHAGFEAVDVHLNDIASGHYRLSDFSVLAACGGFSYGDVLGAGGGWAKSILCNPNLRSEFKAFFERSDTLTLGVCNGCQMLSGLKEIIPGTDHWPSFKKNKSEQFEARLVNVRVNKTNSVFFSDMEDSVLPIHVAHGEGRAVFAASYDALTDKLAPLQYVDHNKNVTEIYPFNPNGSKDGITSLTSVDGRATILMPHPERGFLTQQYSWHPKDWGKYGPWFKLFQNAREWFE